MQIEILNKCICVELKYLASQIDNAEIIDTVYGNKYMDGWMDGRVAGKIMQANIHKCADTSFMEGTRTHAECPHCTGVTLHVVLCNVTAV